MFKGIDFYSDTLTRPSEAMRKAIANAEVGDEQKGEDPTTNALEEKVAGLLGTSTAMFFPSATLANEIAIQLHCDRGDELVAANDCHLFFAEAGGPAILGGVMAKPIPSPNGVFTGAEVRTQFRTSHGPHYPPTKLVSVENTTNMGGGIAWPMATLQDVVKTSKDLGLKLHMDGARFFHAVVKNQVSPKQMASGFDSVTLCLSKGLGCPSGAVLGFDKAHWTRARRLKQLYGGALRQSGILAAAGLYALEHNIERLQEDHDNATRFAKGLAESVPKLKVESTNPSTNMVFFALGDTKLDPSKFMQIATDKGVRFSRVGDNRFRAVTHLDISRDDIDRSIRILQDVFA